MKRDILVIEDDIKLRNFIRNSLEKEGYNCSIASNGKECLKILKHRGFNLLIMDLDLGDMNGKDILLFLRKQLITTPVIVVSTFNNLDIKVNLFEIGCDDYVTKPFFIDELLARVNRNIERSFIPIEVNTRIQLEDVIKFGDMELNFKKMILIKNGKNIELTKKLYELLSYFIKNRNQIITKNQLITHFWNENDILPDNTLAVHIHKIRSIIEVNSSKPEYLTTKRGIGYIFNLKP